MLNSFQAAFHQHYLPVDNKQFTLVIDYPSVERDSEFGLVSELLYLTGNYLSYLIASYLVMDPHFRSNEDLLLNKVVEEVTGCAQGVLDNIDTTYDAEGNLIPIDPDDLYALSNVTQCLMGGYNNPLNVWALSRRVVPLLERYYGHIHLPEDMEIFDDWDVDLVIQGECAIIQFTDSNSDIMTGLVSPLSYK